MEKKSGRLSGHHRAACPRSEKVCDQIESSSFDASFVDALLVRNVDVVEDSAARAPD